MDRDNTVYNFFEYHQFNEEKRILLAYNGRMSQTVLQNIVSILEARLLDVNQKENYTRRIISIVIELIQNIQRYSSIKTGTPDNNLGHGSIVIRETEQGFIINSGNPVGIDEGKSLIEYCNHFTGLKDATLKKLYQKKLKAQRDKNSDRAGVGLLQILRKSGSGMQITTHETGTNNLFVVFTVTVE